MSQSQPKPLIVRFSVFEVNVASRELFKGGTRLKVQQQPFEILCMLLQRPGEVVSREELRERLWPENTFVEYEDSLNTAVRKLRAALSDSSELPRYIETVARQGYRFIAPVQYPNLQSTSIPSGSAESSPTPRHSSAGSLVPWKMWSSPRRSISLGLLLIVLAATGFLWKHWRRSLVVREGSATVGTIPKVAGKDFIILSDFVNKTGDPIFDETLKQALSMQLMQSRFLSVLSDLQVAEVMRRMGRSPTEVLTPELAAEVCQRTGGKAVLEGMISTLGSHYILGLEALDCSNGETLAVTQTEVETKENVLQAVSLVASQVRGKLGESLPSLKKYDFPVNATTNSLEALKAFSMGLAAERNAGVTASIPFYQHAIQLDHNFALAYAVLGRAYEDYGEDGNAMRHYDRAYQLRRRLSERERYLVATLYNETVTGDLEQARKTGELWTATYPTDSYAREKLATVYADLGAMQEAYSQAKEALQLNPGSGVNVFNMVEAALDIDQLDEATRVISAANSRGLAGEEIHESSYEIAFQRGDTAEMERQVDWAMGKSGIEEYLLVLDSQTDAYFGGIHAARDLSHRARESAMRNEAREFAANDEVMCALLEVEVGNTALAGQHIRSALSLAPTRNIKVQAALALARSSHADSARALLRELEANNPANTLIKYYWVPAIKASISIQGGNPRAAISQLTIVAPYELSQPATLNASLYMYPAYIRGEAYLAVHEGRAAAAEFRKVLEHHGVVQNGLLGALSRLQLARAEAMSGDLAEARQEYRDFLSLWKDADGDVPLLERAKSEYASCN